MKLLNLAVGNSREGTSDSDRYGKGIMRPRQWQFFPLSKTLCVFSIASWSIKGAAAAAGGETGISASVMIY